MSGELELNPLVSFNNSVEKKLPSDIRMARRDAGAPLALVEDDTDVPPEPPTSGPEIDDLPGKSEADDMFPSRNNPKENDYPGVDDGLLPGRDDNEPEKPFLPEVPEVGRRLPDINVYQKKKIFAQGMMDLALLTANANQLRYVLDAGPENNYYYVNLICIVISILLQITVGVLLLWNSRFNIHKGPQIILANKINNFTVIGIFLITILNVLISAFGLPDRSNRLPPGAPPLLLSQQVQTVESVTYK